MNKDKEFHNYIFFTAYSEGLTPLAYKLFKEGKNVLIGQVDDLNSVAIKKKETPDKKKRRLSNYNGLLKKEKAEDLIKRIEKIPNKDEYFVVFENSFFYEMAAQVRKMGFINGIFPSKLDWKLENDRNFAKQYVNDFYPDLCVADMAEFKTIEEGIEYVEKSEEFLALKGNDVYAMTVVPKTTKLEFAKAEIINALKNDKENYESKGFILENQIRDGIEFCMEQIWYDGELVTSSVDIENKSFGSSNNSIKLGCLQNLICAVPLDASIQARVFPPIVEKLAKKHAGLYFSDANTILKDGKLYFLEFCGNRAGIDAIQTECDMAGGVSEFFNAVANKRDPFKKKFGVGIRGINMHRDGDEQIQQEEKMVWNPEYEAHIWPFEIQSDEKGGFMSTGYSTDLVVFTESSNELEYAVIKAYDVMEEFSFDEMYYRSMGDFMDREYPGNIMDRYEAIEKLICSPVEEQK